MARDKQQCHTNSSARHWTDKYCNKNIHGSLPITAFLEMIVKLTTRPRIHLNTQRKTETRNWPHAYMYTTLGCQHSAPQSTLLHYKPSITQYIPGPHVAGLSCPDITQSSDHMFLSCCTQGALSGDKLNLRRHGISNVSQPYGWQSRRTAHLNTSPLSQHSFTGSHCFTKKAPIRATDDDSKAPLHMRETILKLQPQLLVLFKQSSISH